MNLGHPPTSNQEEVVATLFDASDPETVLSVNITGEPFFGESVGLPFAPYEYLQDPGASQDFASEINLGKYQFYPSIQEPIGKMFSLSQYLPLNTCIDDSLAASTSSFGFSPCSSTNAGNVDSSPDVIHQHSSHLPVEIPGHILHSGRLEGESGHRALVSRYWMQLMSFL